MADLDFFDSTGRPIAYSPDGDRIYSWGGKALGFIQGYAVYNNSGRHIGWFNDGWIVDRGGYHSLFSPGAKGGPMRPLRQLSPLKGLRELAPLKPLAELPGLKPLGVSSWTTSIF
jgi:hypothetical protein